MRYETMSLGGNVIRFPVELRAKPSIEVLMEIQPDVREVMLVAEAFGLDGAYEAASAAHGGRAGRLIWRSGASGGGRITLRRMSRRCWPPRKRARSAAAAAREKRREAILVRAGVSDSEHVGVHGDGPWGADGGRLSSGGAGAPRQAPRWEVAGAAVA